MHHLNGLSNKIILHACDSCDVAKRAYIIDTMINIVYPSLLADSTTKVDDQIADI